jgi:adenylylsulfate kinase-like enzyme
MNRDPIALRREATAYRELAEDVGTDSMFDAPEQVAIACETLASELESLARRGGAARDAQMR